MSAPPSLNEELQQTQRSSSWLLPLFIFGICLTMTLGVGRHLQQEAELEWQTSVSHEAALITSEIRERLRAHAQFLRSIRAFVSASREINPAIWRAFSEELLIEQNVPGIQAYGFAPWVANAEQAGLLAELRRYPSFSNFAIRPQTDRRYTLPATYLAPDTPANKTAVGFNIYSEQRRIEAVDLARDRNEVVLSHRVELVTESDATQRQPGILMFLPVYRPGMPTTSIEQRRRAFAGVVYAAYRMNDFMRSLNFANSSNLGVRIFDDESFNANTNGPSLSLLHTSSGEFVGDAAEQREMEFGQRNWQLRFFPLSAKGLHQDTLLVLAGGFLLSLLLALISRAQASHRDRAESLAHEMTRELRASEERLTLASEGAMYGIFDRDLVNSKIWRSDRLKQILGVIDDAESESAEAFMSRVHPGDRALIESTLQRHLSQRTPYVVEYRFHKEGKHWIWLQSQGCGVWDKNGKAIRLVGSITDISERKEAEQRVAHYRDFLATVLKFIPHPVFVKNSRREYIAVNAAFCHLVDRPESEIIGNVALGRTPMPEEITRQIRRMDDQVFASGGEQLAEHELPLRRGIRTVITRKALASDPDGQPILIGTLTDVTDLRRAERERSEADRQRKAILDAATEVAIIATDTNGTVKLFNRGAEKMLGYRADEMIDRQTPALLHLEEEVRERATFLSAELGTAIAGFEVFITQARTHGSERREWTYVRKNGTQLRVSLVVTAVRDDGGDVIGYLGIAVDVTERESLLAELRLQNARTQSIIEHIPGGVSLIDKELHFAAANDELKRVLDFPDALFAAGPPSLYEVALFNARRGDYGPGDPQEQAMAVVERARHPTAHCFERTRPNGQTIEVRGAPLPDGGFVTIYTDITARKAAEAELRNHRDRLQELVEERTVDLINAKEAAERASEAKSEFLANMSHELRTPMHSVLSFASLGEEKSQALAQEKLGHYFQRIHQSGSRLLNLLNELLDLSKLEAGMMHLQQKDEDVLDLVREAVAEAESWATTRKLRLLVEARTADTGATIDATRIGQVIRNLLSNAIKFSPEGSTVRILLDDAQLPSGRRTTDRSDIPALCIEVKDEGVGIPDTELERIFDKFVQSSSTKTGAGGTGLGLAICREIVHAHRGSIKACNNSPAGASLIVILPRSPQHPA